MSRPLENLPRALGTLGVVVTTILIATYAFMHENYFLMAAVVIAAPLVAMINNPPAWIILILALSQSSLIVPGLPRGLQLVHFLMAGFGALVIARNIIVKPARLTAPSSFYCLWAFALLCVFIISQRGFGLQMFGGAAIGGAVYVKFFISTGFLLCSRYIALTPRQWRLAIILMLLGTLLPVAAEGLYALSGGKVVFQYNFIAAYVSGLQDMLASMDSGQGVVRFTALTSLSTILLMVTLLFTVRRSEFTLLTVLMTGVCIVMVGLSGFRSAMVGTLATILLYYILLAPKNLRRQRAVLMTGMFAVALLAVLPFMAHLPLSIQRAFAWLPFANIDPVAQTDATGTATWRLELWKYCLQQAPEYLWVGRGFTVDTDILFSPSVYKDQILGPWFSHGYHNGPIGLLIDTGIPGLLCATLFLLFATLEVLKNDLQPKDRFIHRFFVFMKAQILWNIIAFFFIGGSIETLMTIFFYLAIFYGLQITDIAQVQKRVKRDFALVDPSFGSSSPVRPANR